MTAPTVTARNARLLRVLDVLDVVVPVLGIGAGVIVFVAPPPSFIQAVTIPWLAVVWGVLLLGGGVAALFGRLSGIWLPESVGILGLAAGGVIYCLTLGTAAITKHELGTGVAIAFFIIAIVSLVRRYVQLQIFTSEPVIAGTTVWQRILSVFRIRTDTARTH